MKQVSLCEAEGRDRYAAALLDFQDTQGLRSLLVVALLLQSGIDSSGWTSLAFEDWNLEQSEGDVAMFLQQGIVHTCDEAACGKELPCTDPRRQGGARRRRIDYAVSIGDLFATQVDHIPEEELGGLSDHLAVSYSFDLCAPPVLHGSKRRMCPASDASDDARPAPPHAFAASLEALLSEGDLDAAWTFLSDQAKDVLFAPA